MSRVLLLGSSHVNRFRNYVDRNVHLHNFAFSHNSVVQFYGIGGERINNINHTSMCEQQIANYMPHYLVFHVSGNDVDVVRAVPTN
jgi:hypothetical protein